MFNIIQKICDAREKETSLAIKALQNEVKELRKSIEKLEDESFCRNNPNGVICTNTGTIFGTSYLSGYHIKVYYRGRYYNVPIGEHSKADVKLKNNIFYVKYGDKKECYALCSSSNEKAKIEWPKGKKIKLETLQWTTNELWEIFSNSFITYN